MTQEQKELLLKDLCGRWPYGVKVNEGIQGDFTLIGLTKERVFTTCEVESCHNDFPIELIKPYLFPLSSMTDEQKQELNKLSEKECCIIEDVVNNPNPLNAGFPVVTHYMVDWCNKNHFDYRGLIEKGLAIDATNLKIY